MRLEKLMMNYLRQFKLQLKIFLLEKIHWLILVLALVLLFTDISFKNRNTFSPCLLYTSDAADDPLCVELGGRRIIKKKKPRIHTLSPTTTNHHTPSR